MARELTWEWDKQGDFDGLAAHYGKKDWNDLNTTALTAASDPQWKANLETRRELEKVRQERETEKRQLQELHIRLNLPKK